MIVKSDEQLVALSDGRLSRDDDSVSLDSTSKIQIIHPFYRYPEVRMGRVQTFWRYSGEKWCVAYAGTYTLANEIINLFRATITNLTLDRDKKGNPFLGSSFNQYGSFGDDFNFTTEEKLKFDGRLVVEYFRDAFQRKASEWITNRGPTDCEFLLFGLDQESLAYTAYKIWNDPGQGHRDGKAAISVEEIPNGTLQTIGSPSISSALFSDTDLQSGVKTWGLPRQYSYDLDITGIDTYSPAQEERWSRQQILNGLLAHISGGEDPSVGGEFLWADGGIRGLELRTI